MVKIPTLRLEKVSQVVGTPGVDTSQADMFGSVASGTASIAEDLLKQKKLFAEVERKKQEIEAESVATNQETSFLVNDLNPLMQKIKTDPRHISDPTNAQNYLLEEGQKLIDTRSGKLTPMQQQAFGKKATSELQQAISQLNTWSVDQIKNNAVDNRLEQVNTLEIGARNAQSFNDFKKLYDKVPSVANAAVIGDAPKFEAKAREGLADSYFYGNYYNNPQRLLNELDSGFGTLVSAEKAKDYRRILTDRVENIKHEKQDQATQYLLEKTRADAQGLMSGTVNRMDWDRATAQLAIAGAEPKVVSLRNSLAELIFNPSEEQKKLQAEANKEMKANRQMRYAELLTEYVSLNSSLNDKDVTDEEYIRAVSDYQVEVGNEFTKGKISKDQYNSLLRDPIRDLNETLPATKKTGLQLPWSNYGIGRALGKIDKYSENLTSDAADKNMLMQRISTAYLGMYNHFKETNNRVPTSEENKKLVDSTLSAYSSRKNPHLDNVAKEGTIMEDSRGQWLIFPDHSYKFLGK